MLVGILSCPKSTQKYAKIQVWQSMALLQLFITASRKGSCVARLQSLKFEEQKDIASNRSKVCQTAKSKALIQKFWPLFHKFCDELIVFLHFLYSSIFCLAAFFVLHTVGFFFNTSWYQICLATLGVTIVQGASPFQNLSYIDYYPCLSTKRLLCLHKNANISDIKLCIAI